MGLLLLFFFWLPLDWPTQHFENTGQRGESLEKLFQVLKNVAPTSVAAEQAFSVAASFITSRRLRLSDKSIDDLCFEKAYFDNNGY